MRLLNTGELTTDGHTGLAVVSALREQRKECRKRNLYPECPRAIKIESLNKPIVDSEGNITELGELIADDKAIDLEAWLDKSTFLLGFPARLVEIAHKRLNGQALTNKDKCYLWRYRHTEQKILV